MMTCPISMDDIHTDWSFFVIGRARVTCKQDTSWLISLSRSGRLKGLGDGLKKEQMYSVEALLQRIKFSFTLYSSLSKHSK